MIRRNLLFLIFAVLLSFTHVWADNDSGKAKMVQQILAYFDLHESEIREFERRGGHLPAQPDQYFFLIREIAKELGGKGSKLNESDIRQSISFLRREVAYVSTITAPNQGVATIDQLNDHLKTLMDKLLIIDKLDKALSGKNEEKANF
jgi:hypothetical protein